MTANTGNFAEACCPAVDQPGALNRVVISGNRKWSHGAKKNLKNSKNSTPKCPAIMVNPPFGTPRTQKSRGEFSTECYAHSELIADFEREWIADSLFLSLNFTTRREIGSAKFGVCSRRRSLQCDVAAATQVIAFHNQPPSCHPPPTALPTDSHPRSLPCW